MPSEYQPVSQDDHTHDRSEELREQFGEDPARFLDRPLFGSDSQFNTEPGWFIQKRIEGIDSLAVIGVWLAVENSLDHGPRRKVRQMLHQRAQKLQEIGERPDRCEPGNREPRESEWHIVRDGERKPWDEVDRSVAGVGSGSHELAVATDGGESDG